MSERETVFVGLSGGVDSSVALLRLKNAGYNVVAVFIKTWQPDFTPCTWKRDRLDAMRVAAHLGVPFITFDATDAYKQGVADYLIREYGEGRTPNPDVMCNEEVKFGVFYDFALARGATKVATGHYARIESGSHGNELHRGVDVEKDQSYFLWRLTRDKLSHILFPIGNSTKAHIRREARDAGIPTSEKPDSQGICFLGHVDIREFLSHYLTLTRGAVVDTRGNTIGMHEGAILYTLGQRHGFTIQRKGVADAPYYVIDRDIEKNTITVANTLRACDNAHIELADMHLCVDELPSACEAQFRYRQKPFRVQLADVHNGRAMLKVVDDGIDIPSAGQSCVLYHGTHCLGGGIINTVLKRA